MRQVSKFALYFSLVQLKRRKTAYQGCSVFSLLVNEVLLALII